MNTPKREGWVDASGLNQWRHKQKLSQEALAQKAGVSRATISSAENGHRLSFAQADAIAQALGTTRDKLAKAPDPDEEDVLVLV